MDLTTTISMDTKKAREAFLEYKKSVEQQHQEAVDEAERKRRQENRMLMNAYKELSKGKRLINSTQALLEAGTDERGLPKIAICRADALRCTIRKSFGSQGSVYYFCNADEPRPDSRHTNKNVVLPNGLVKTKIGGLEPDYVSVLPNIPPKYRPKNLSNYHLLWDAHWEKVPPKDPILMRRIGGLLFAVVAQWDLTKVERAILYGRT